MVYRIISQNICFSFSQNFKFLCEIQLFPLSSLWHLRHGVTEVERMDAAKRWAKCQDHFLNTALQKGNIPHTAQHHHLSIITCPNALCPILPPSSLWSAPLTHLDTQTLQSLNSRSLETRGLGDGQEQCMDSGSERGGWAEAWWNCPAMPMLLWRKSYSNLVKPPLFFCSWCWKSKSPLFLQSLSFQLEQHFSE